jgi:cryptochrome
MGCSAENTCTIHFADFNIFSLYILQEWNITVLSFEEDPEPFGKNRDAAITAMAKEVGVEVVKKSSHTLYDLQK